MRSKELTFMKLWNMIPSLRQAMAMACGMAAIAALNGASVWAQAPSEREGEGSPYRIAERSNPNPSDARSALGAAQPNEHPLMPVLRWANDGLREMDKLQDYSAMMMKHERVDGKLNDPEVAFIKVRQKPMSVYMYFAKPEALKGQEVIYVQGANNNKLLGHGTGFRKVFGTVPLEPTGPIAMKGNRYPITEIGIVNLVRRLVEVGEEDTKYGECEVKYLTAKINDRPCTCIRVVHPTPRRNFRFHVAQIFVDNELNLPVRYESYDWPAKPEGQPELIEEYTYYNIKLNNGFTDADFDVHNPKYNFKPAPKK
jgi:hypothetical protein